MKKKKFVPTKRRKEKERIAADLMTIKLLCLIDEIAERKRLLNELKKEKYGVRI